MSAAFYLIYINICFLEFELKTKSVIATDKKQISILNTNEEYVLLYFKILKTF